MIALGKVFIRVNQGCQIGEIWALGLTLGEQAGDAWRGGNTNEKVYEKHKKDANAKHPTLYPTLVVGWGRPFVLEAECMALTCYMCNFFVVSLS